MHKVARSTNMRLGLNSERVARSGDVALERAGEDKPRTTSLSVRGQVRGTCKNNAEVCVAGEGGSGGSEDAPKDPTVCVAAVKSSIASRASQPRTHGMDNFTHLSADKKKHREGGIMKV